MNAGNQATQESDRRSKTKKVISDSPHDVARSNAGATAIVVIGMHRSGTSALAGVLRLMGAYVGETRDLLLPHPTDNPSGYWERTDIVSSHDEFLESAGFAWNELADFHAADCDSSAKEALRARLRATIAKLEANGDIWLVKDPRICLLLSQWFAVLDRAACVVVVRDPRSIVASILRERLRGVYTSHFLLALWEKYLRTALADLQGRQTLFVSYDQFIANPATECSRLRDGLIQLGVSGLNPVPKGSLDTFLDPRLKRSRARSDLDLSSAQQRLYSWLDAQCRAPSPVMVNDVPNGSSADATLLEYALLSEYTKRGARHQVMAESSSEVAAVEKMMFERQNEFSRFSDMHAQMNEQLSQLRVDLTQRNQQVLKDSRTIAAELDKRIEANRDVLDRLQREDEERAILKALLAEKNSQVERTLAALEHANAERIRIEGELADVKRELATAGAHSAAMEAARDDLASRVKHLEVSLKNMTTEAESARLSRDRALDAAVRVRRVLDARVSDPREP